MIDVVIPIYGNLAALERCVSSVVKHTGGDHRLILIDDASPDPRIGEYLRAVAVRPRTIVLRNRTNRGFTGTVNRAFRMSRSDVVLLNSDTIVTARWLEKLHAAATSEPLVATVTPFTNCGTIAAVPVWNVRNEIPAGRTLEEFAAMVERLSARSYPRLPTGVGFCMYVTRESIDAVGVLDEATFARGYGEENDFCMRASALGFRHLLDDATFVFHEGEGSFGAEKAALYEANYRALLAKHPTYGERVHAFIDDNPLDDLQASIRDAIRGRFRPRVRVLVLLHRPLDIIGGTEAHTRDLVGSVDGADLLVAHRQDEAIRVDEYRRGVCVSKDAFKSQGSTKTRGRAWYRDLLRRLRVQVLHVQHLLDHEPAILAAAKDLSIPTMLVWHDFFLACPSYNLLNDARRFCDWCRDLAECDRCLDRQWRLPHGFQRRWRDLGQQIVDRIDAHVFPSEACREGAQRFFSIDPARIHVLPHGQTLPGSRSEVSRLPGKRLRVAFLGVRSLQKGAEVFRRLVEIVGGDVDWHVFGAAPPEADARLGIVHNHGSYHRGEICERLHDASIDVVLLLSIWPETFCYTLSEAWLAGIPVVGSELGAIGERLRESGAGWAVDVDRPEAIAELLRSLDRDRDTLARATRRARETPLAGLDVMAKQYRALYASLADREPSLFPVRHSGGSRNRADYATDRGRVGGPLSSV